MEFFISLSGVEQIYYTKPRIPLGDGFSNIAFPGYKPGLSMEIKRNTPIQVFSVYMQPDVFEKLTGKSGEELVGALDIIDRNTATKGNPARSRKIDFAQNLCGYQVFDSLMNNPRDTLLMEAKALELVALQLRQLDHLTGKTPRKQAVDHHVEKISYACEILRKEMTNPPRVLELARRVGLNHNHLIQGFKDMFSLSPFEYLRVIRLEKARDLIASHECNVTEAAFSVGYSSLSHFTKAFREEFGVNPKACA
jgi:AraC-like DNA-binding protein